MTAISTPINRRTFGITVPRFALVAFVVAALAVAAVIVAVLGPGAVSGRTSIVHDDPGSVSAPLSSEYLRSIGGSWNAPASDGAGAPVNGPFESLYLRDVARGWTSGAAATTTDAPYYSQYVQDMARGW